MIPATAGTTRPREKFTEASMPNEPASDRKLVLSDGTLLRERMADVPSPNGLYMRWTLARLDADGAVVLNADGSPDLAPPHEHSILAEGAAAMPQAELDEVILREREIAAAMAKNHFAGMTRLKAMTAGRTAV